MNETEPPSCPPPYHFNSTILSGIFTSLIILFGLLANVLNFKIFSHKLLRSSILNWYLSLLSLSDSVVLSTGFFFICLPRIGEFSHQFYLVNLAHTLVPVAYPLGLIAQTCSVWLTILMSAHRFVGVCLPLKSNSICTRRKCRTAVVGVLIFSLLFNITKFWELHLDQCYSYHFNYTFVVPTVTPLRHSELYKRVYLVWLCSIVMFFVPFSVLIVLNTAVMVTILKSRKRRVSLCAINIPKPTEIAKEISVSTMLVGVVVVFLICNVLPFIVNLLEMIDAYRDFESPGSFLESSYFNVMVDLSNNLVMLNASANIFVYIWFMKKFRFLLRCYLFCRASDNAETSINLSTQVLKDYT